MDDFFNYINCRFRGLLSICYRWLHRNNTWTSIINKFDGFHVRADDALITQLTYFTMDFFFFFVLRSSLFVFDVKNAKWLTCWTIVLQWSNFTDTPPLGQCVRKKIYMKRMLMCSSRFRYVRVHFVFLSQRWKFNHVHRVWGNAIHTSFATFVFVLFE